MLTTRYQNPNLCRSPWDTPISQQFYS